MRRIIMRRITLFVLLAVLCVFAGSAIAADGGATVGGVVFDSSLGWPMAALGVGLQVLLAVREVCRSACSLADAVRTDGLRIRIRHDVGADTGSHQIHEPTGPLSLAQ